MPTQRNYLINTTTISTTASGTTIASGNTQSATFVTALTLVRTGISAVEFASGSQTWAIHYVVSAMTTPYEMRLSLQRRNSAGTVQATIGPGTVRSATGTYDDNLTGDLGVWAANDQLALVWEHRRPSGSGNKNATIDANGSSYIDAPTPPLDLPKTAADDVNLLADARGLGYGNLHTDSVNNLADTAQIALGLSLAVSDNANILTDGGVTVIGYWSAISDSLQTLTDALARLLSYQLLFADSEAANWADSHNLLLSQFLALADSNSLSDAALAILDHRTQPTDTLNSLTDSLEQHLGVAHELDDDLNTLDDSFAFLLTYNLDLSDSNLTFPSTPILDDFNRADGGPPPSANWTTGVAGGFEGFAEPGFDVVSNQLRNLGNDVAQQYWNAEQFGPDAEAYITLANSSDLHTLTLAARLTDIGEFTTEGYAVFILFSDQDGGKNNYFIYKITNGLLAIIASSSELVPSTPVSGHSYGIRTLGDKIQFWADTGHGWELKLGTTDSSYSTAGFIGLNTESNINSRQDNFGGGTVKGGFSDALVVEVVEGPNLALDLSDAITLIDSLTLGLGLLLTEAGVTLTDALALRADELLAFSDLITLTDSESHTLGLQLALTETLALNDSLALGHGLLCADSFLLSDALAIQAGQLVSASDTITLTDSESHLLGQLVTFSDDLNLLADFISLQMAYALSLTDALSSLSDTLTLQLAQQLSFSDSITLTDTYAHDLVNTVEATTEEVTDDVNILTDQLALGFGLVLSDNAASLTDTESHLLGQSVALADSTTPLNDTITLRLTQALDFSDTLTLTDSKAAVLGQRQSLSDSLASFDDAVVVQLDQRFSFSDSLATLNDAYTQTVAEMLSFFDALTLTDSTQLGYGLSIADDINLLIDAILTSAPQGPLRQVGVTDSVDNLTDSVALRLDYLLTVADSTNLNDSLALNQGLLVAFADTLSLTDAITSTLGHLLPLVDTITLNDSVQLRLGYELIVADVVTLTDTAILNLGYSLILSDNASLLADSTLKSLGLTLIITDNVPTLTDAISLFSAWLLQLSDALTLADSLTKSGAGFLSLADSFALTDSVTIELRGPDLDESLADSLTLTDAISLTLGNELQLQVVISDTIALTDHYFDLRHPYTPSTKRHIVVPSRARTTTPTRRRGVIVPASERTTRVE